MKFTKNMKRLTYQEPKRRGRHLGWFVASEMACVTCYTVTSLPV